MFEIINLCDCRQFIPTLARWHQDEWGYLNPNTKSIESRIEEFGEHLAETLVPSTMVAVRDGELIGSASLIQCDLTERPELTPWLASVYVAMDYRRQGVGERLVRGIESLAKTTGCAQLFLYTTDRASFYEKLGWAVFENTTHEEVEIVIMRLAVCG